MPDATGKILADTATVGSLNIKEKDFLVVMVSKVSLSLLLHSLPLLNA